MLFGVVSGVSQGMGVLDGGGDRPSGRGSCGDTCGASNCNHWQLCDIVIVCREGWRCSSSQITTNTTILCPPWTLFFDTLQLGNHSANVDET